MDKIGEFVRVADEEDRRIVAGEVPIAFPGVEFHRKAAQVTLGIGRTEFAGNIGEAREHVGLLADLRKDLGLGVFGDVVGDCECPVRAPALGMDGAFRNSLAVLVGELFEQLVVLQEHRTVRPRGDRILIIRDRSAGTRR